jgi:hypothetical protein
LFVVLWVLLAIVMQILYRLAFGFDEEIYKFFAILQGIAYIVINSVYLAILVNYSTQCELIIFYVREIRTRLEEKSISLKEAMQV